MIKASKAYAILKVGPRKFMEEFVTEGRIYMNTLKYFKDLESKDALRSDKSEGLTASYPAHKMRIHVGGHEIKNLTGQVRFGHPEHEKIAIFSMYALTELNLDAIIDDRVLGFGDTTVVITKADEFMDRIRQECEKRNWLYQTDLVTYVHKDTHEGDMGVFRKYSDLSYQSEFRIAVKSGRSGPIDDFYIGDISDIVQFCDSATVKSQFNIIKDA